MICPKCNGRGFKLLMNRFCDLYTEICDKCGGSGVVEPMTNEEYIHSLTTEQLAWFIAKAMLFYDNTTMSLLDAIKKAMEYDKKASDHFTDDIVEWLKKPHTKE